MGTAAKANITKCRILNENVLGILHMASGSNNVGRPRLQVDVEEIAEMRKLGVSISKISEVLGLSRSTLYRVLEGSDLIGVTEISDQELDSVVASYKETHPNDGERILIGYIRSKNIHVPRSRIRSSIRRVDPHGIQQRKLTTIQRRTYHVEGPNYVWHMDGNHKLIRWKFIIHGAIDGYSRLVVFLKCSTNNTAATVFDSFIAATQSYGVPKRLRTDLGGENVDAWQYMVDYHGGNERCVITGSSIHNERIERLWRDVRNSVITTFRQEFLSLEQEEILDVENDTDLFCLHEVYIDRINHSLIGFVNSWNNHPLTTEHNHTPLQLFHIRYSLDSESSGDDVQPQSQQRYTSLQTTSYVDVPNLSFNPCLSLLTQVKVMVSQTSALQGSAVYRQVVLAVGQHITSGCLQCTFT